LPNSTSITTTVKVFLCPSNPRADTKITAAYYTHDAAPTDYILSAGGVALLTCASPYSLNTNAQTGFPGPFRPAAGAFNVNSKVNTQTFKDGMSNTFLMGEGHGGAQLPVAAPAINFTRAQVDGTGVLDLSLAVDQPWSQGYIGNYTSGSIANGGFGSVFGFTAFDAWYNNRRELQSPGDSPNGFTPLRPNGDALRYLRGTTMQTSLSSGLDAPLGQSTKPTNLTAVSGSPFRAYHPASLQFLFGDGSVQTVSQNIDARTYVGLSSVNGGEIINWEGVSP
jgi:hypothetical protein